MNLRRDPVSRLIAPERPLRILPRWASLAILLGTACALVWSSLAVRNYATSIEERDVAEAAVEPPKRGDVELYARINARMRQGEGYYSAALAEQRADNYPTRPFVTVRLPTMAWGGLLWGEAGWRVVAVLLLAANVLAWVAAPRCATLIERTAAGLLTVASGAGAFFDRVGLVHELMTGLLLSLSLALYRPHRWWPALLAAAVALAIREIALPFVLLWAAFAVAQRRWREFAAICALLALFSLGMALHAWNVADARLPGDPVSPGWDAMLGLRMVLHSLAQLSPLLLIKPEIAGPLALLPLLGWAAMGGRCGVFGLLWFAGFGLAVALFARANNFYWVLLMLPAYALGLAFVPRALADLWLALLHPGVRAATSGPMADNRK